MNVNEEADYSCIRSVKQVVHIVLPPSYIGNEKKGVIDILNSWKTQYVRSLEGIVIGFQNVAFVEREGFIITDQPYIHHDVEATFKVFRPVVGSIVKGVINRVSQEHIGCIVHDCINVSIHLSSSVLPELSSYIGTGETLFFKITHVEFSRRVIRIRGEISEDCVRIMQTMFPNAPNHSYLEGEVENDRVDDEDALTSNTNSYPSVNSTERNEGIDISNNKKDRSSVHFNNSSPVTKRKRSELNDKELYSSSEPDSYKQKKKRRKHDLSETLMTNDSTIVSPLRRKHINSDLGSTNPDSSTDSSVRKKKHEEITQVYTDSSVKKKKRKKHNVEDIFIATSSADSVRKKKHKRCNSTDASTRKKKHKKCDSTDSSTRKKKHKRCDSTDSSTRKKKHKRCDSTDSSSRKKKHKKHLEKSSDSSTLKNHKHLEKSSDSCTQKNHKRHRSGKPNKTHSSVKKLKHNILLPDNSTDSITVKQEVEDNYLSL